MRRHLRLIPGWKLVLLLAAPIAIAVGALAAAHLYSSSAAATAANTHPVIANPVLDVPPPTGLLVHVIGAVENPGLYRLPRGGRVYDAIAAAAGLAPGADLTKLPNLARRAKDGHPGKHPFPKTPSPPAIPPPNPNPPTLPALLSPPPLP